MTGGERAKSAAIIVAAGKGTRAGFDKITAPLGSRSVLSWSVKAFLNSPLYEEVIVVTSQEGYTEIQHLRFEEGKKFIHVGGGETRQNSVWAGLKAVSKEVKWVSVHDGARPLITPSAIARCLAEAQKCRAATLAHRIPETVKHVTEDNCTTGRQVDRRSLWLMETPQSFDVSLLREAYEKIKQEGAAITDEVSALEFIGYPTKIVENRTPNIKITLAEDLEIASQLLPYIREKIEEEENEA